MTHAASIGTKQATPLGMEIEHRTLVRAPRYTVYRALTTAAGFDEWFTTGAEIVPEPGGVMHLRWRDWGADAITVEDRGEVVEAVAPERFVFRWHGNGLDGGLTTVELDFLEDERGTIVSLRESGYEDSDEGRSEFVSCCAGWRGADADEVLCRAWRELLTGAVSAPTLPAPMTSSSLAPDKATVSEALEDRPVAPSGVAFAPGSVSAR